MNQRKWSPDPERISEHARALLAGEATRQGVACLGETEISASIHYATILETELTRSAAIPLLAEWSHEFPRPKSKDEQCASVEFFRRKSLPPHLFDFVLLELGIDSEDSEWDFALAGGHTKGKC